MRFEYLKDKTIFIGNNDIASQISDLKRILDRERIKSVTLHDADYHPIIREEVSINLRKLKEVMPIFRPHSLNYKLRLKWSSFLDQLFFNRMLKKCDVFIFFWKTFFPGYKDLEVLRKNGKKVVVCFVGDDVRWFYAQKQEFNYYNMPNLEYEKYDYGVGGLISRLERLRLSEKYADMIFSRLDQAQLQLRPYYRFHMMIDNYLVSPNFFQRKDKPKVLHAPSSRKFKGSQFVLRAFEDLRKEGVEFESILIEGLKNDELLKTIADSDIIVDQLICPGSGKFATEGLAYGKVVISNMRYNDYPQNDNLNYPIIDANPDNIKEVLRNVILNYELRLEKALEGRRFSEAVLDYQHFLKKIDDFFSGKNVLPDYQPTFFRNQFIPESSEATKCYNDYNELVKDCNWYLQNIPGGRRANLEF